MDGGNVRASVGVSEDMVSTSSVRLPSAGKEPVSARVDIRIVRKLDHYAKLAQALAASTGEDAKVIGRINRSYVVEEALLAGIDVLLAKFGGWLETEEGRKQQIEAVRAGQSKPE